NVRAVALTLVCCHDVSRAVLTCAMRLIIGPRCWFPACQGTACPGNSGHDRTDLRHQRSQPRSWQTHRSAVAVGRHVLTAAGRDQYAVRLTDQPVVEDYLAAAGSVERRFDPDQVIETRR